MKICRLGFTSSAQGRSFHVVDRTGKAVESSKMYNAREKHANLYLLNMNICEVIIFCLKGRLIRSYDGFCHENVR